MQLEKAVAGLEPKLIEWRRRLHAHPEISFEEYKTTEFIAKALEQLGVSYERPTKTGLVAHITGEKPGEPGVLGFRADIDALPMPEENDLPYRSQTENVMHACGHDGHTAMLLGLAQMLVQNKDSFCGEARLFFQHAEELPPGGAIELVRAGAADGVDAMLGLHLSSDFPAGVFGVKSGVLTANVDRAEIRVTGKGGHCAFPQLCDDPVIAASEIVLAAQSIVSRRVAPKEPAVVSICEIHGGTAYNIIPNDVRLSASIRSFGETARKLIQNELTAVCTGVAAAHRCKADVEWVEGYPSVVNDETLTQTALKQIGFRFGPEHIEQIGVIMPGEDFSYFLDGRPGFFVELGTRNAAIAADRPHHNPKYRMDESALVLGMQYEFDMARALLDGTGGIKRGGQAK